MRPQIDRRAFGRRNQFVRGTIRVSGRSKLHCVVRNVSRGGAFLEFSPPAWLPFQFELELPASGELISCEIRHKGSTGVGVRFLMEDASEAKPEDTIVYGDEIEAWRGSGAIAQRTSSRIEDRIRDTLRRGR